jgi:hypothetical protein
MRAKGYKGYTMGAIETCEPNRFARGTGGRFGMLRMHGVAIGQEVPCRTGGKWVPGSYRVCWGSRLSGFRSNELDSRRLAGASTARYLYQLGVIDSPASSAFLIDVQRDTGSIGQKSH